MEVFAVIMEKGAIPAGPPVFVCRQTTMAEVEQAVAAGDADLEVAFPVANRVKPEGDVAVLRTARRAVCKGPPPRPVRRRCARDLRAALCRARRTGSRDHRADPRVLPQRSLRGRPRGDPDRDPRAGRLSAPITPLSAPSTADCTTPSACVRLSRRTRPCGLAVRRRRAGSRRRGARASGRDPDPRPPRRASTGRGRLRRPASGRLRCVRPRRTARGRRRPGSGRRSIRHRELSTLLFRRVPRHDSAA